MDVHWMQTFLCLLHCDAQPSPSSLPLRTNRPLSLDDLEGDDDLRSEFACPFCYEEFDIGSLCFHLEEDHCFESKSVVCPVCCAKVGNDIVGHITLQHGHFFKMQRRRRIRKTTTSTNSPSLIASEEASPTSSLFSDEHDTSKGSSLTAEECEQKLEEVALHAKFVQQLVLSTIFRND